MTQATRFWVISLAIGLAIAGTASRLAASGDPPGVPATVATQPPTLPRVVIQDFDWATVSSSVQALYGTHVDVGKGIRALLTTRLLEGGQMRLVDREPRAARFDEAEPVDFYVRGDIVTFGRNDSDRRFALGQIGLARRLGGLRSETQGASGGGGDCVSPRPRRIGRNRRRRRGAADDADDADHANACAAAAAVRGPPWDISSCRSSSASSRRRARRRRPPRWPNFARIQRALNREVYFTDISGQERIATILGVGTDAVTLEVGRQWTTVHRDAVLSVDRVKDGDRDGVIKGVMAGLILGAAASAISDGDGRLLVRGAVTYGALGYLFDRANTARQPLYRAP